MSETMVKPILAEDRARRIPPGQTVVTKLPVLSYGPAPRTDLQSWDLKLVGEVVAPVRLDHTQWKALPRVSEIADFHCVTTWSRLDNRWEGVKTSELLTLVQLKPGARFAIILCDGGYTTNLTLEEFLGEDVLLADRLDGQDLSRDHGYPLRLIVPRLYGWKSAKWVRVIEFSAHDRPGFWEVRGYHNHGDPWREERYSEDDDSGDDSGGVEIV
jgi:DMSO/TMAO reductase YedYZ molybdopterin-dependent catalytic subunit